MMTTQTEQTARLEAIVQLLHKAALQTWSAADDTGPDSPLSSLGLGIYLAHARAADLLPDGHRIEGDRLTVLGLEPAPTTLRLLEVAEQLTRPRSWPTATGEPGGHDSAEIAVSQVVTDLLDLIREARALDL